MKRFLMAATTALLLVPMIVSAQTTVTKTVTWTPPAVDATHTAATSYIAQWRVVGSTAWITATPNPATATFNLAFPASTPVEVRVAGIDSQGHQGDWSLTSDPYTWLQPGACGKPSWL